MAEGLVKQLTGGDRVKGRFMRRDFFEFEPTFKIFFAANHKPQVKGTDHAIWRRIRLVPFEVTFDEDERDPQLPDKLNDELPGILAWVVKGCLAWHRDGLVPPEEVLSATSGYRAEMDVLGAFILDCCMTDSDFWSSSGELYDCYCRWCDATGEFTLCKREFGSQLNERGFKKKRKNKARGWQGVKLVEKPDLGSIRRRGRRVSR